MCIKTKGFKMVGKTILEQIKGMDSRALWAWGSKDFISAKESSKNLGYLEFKCTNNPNYKSIKIRITLEFNDTYTVMAYTMYKYEPKIKHIIRDVYFDSLVETIDEILG